MLKKDNINDKENWKAALERDRMDKVKANSRNLEKILSNGKFKGLAYDEFKHQEVIKDDLPWRERNATTSDYEPWLGADDSRLRHYLNKEYDIKGNGVITDAFIEVTRKKGFHPIKEYIESFKWDGVERLETLFIDYLGADDNEYVRTVTRKHLIAGVYRIYEPGCKYDQMLVLVGGQGIGKSTIIKKLGGKWFSDSLDNLDGKEAGEHLQAAWIIEIAELSALKRSEIEEIKKFLSKTEDKYRVAYDRVVSEFLRKCLFFGTTNNHDFLKDQTGNRRFFPVVVNIEKRKFDVFKDLTDEVIGQIWAEALHYYLNGEDIILPEHVKKMAELVQENHMQDDPRLGEIELFLENKNTVCTKEVWVECLKLDSAKMKPHDGTDISNLIQKLGWIKLKERKTHPIYGKQTTFVKNGESSKEEITITNTSDSEFL